MLNTVKINKYMLVLSLIYLFIVNILFVVHQYSISCAEQCLVQTLGDMLDFQKAQIIEAHLA